jgi:diguanylate cyclase (GGDEF)-like protein
MVNSEAPKQNNKTKETIVLVAGIILFLVIMIIQARISALSAKAMQSDGGSTPPIQSLNGVIAQAQVLISATMVVVANKKGYIASVILNLLNSVYTLITAVILAGNTQSIPGVVVPVICIVTMSIIYFYSLKISKTNAELVKTNRTLIETNKVIREKDEKLTYLAYYDVLTGLANRQLFIDHLDEIIEENKNAPFTVIYFDIDNFKQINDAYGHNIGDIMLSTYADRLRLFCGQSNFVGKLGGDEFAVIVNGNNSEASIVDYIEKLRTSVCEPVNANGTILQTSMSFGVASYPSDGISSQDILKSTDIAVYNAKANGKDRTCFYSQHSASRNF